jgi:hypothetical protein
VIAASTVGIKISLLQGSATGSAVYVETHRKTTNANGLVSLEIGTGTVLSGSFVSINWANGPYLIKTETDPTGGTNYGIPGIAPLNSVPYALYAANGTPGPKGDTGATGPAGAIGPQGPIGLTGPTGPAGAQGPIGLTGPAGATGPAGNDGAAGVTGPQGVAGLLTNGSAAGNTPYWNGSTWETNSSNIFNNGGNIGIGTAVPTEKLDITGKVKASGTVTAGTVTYPNTHGSANQVLTTTGSGTLTWTTPSSGGGSGVPYTGATQAVDLGAYDLKVNGLTVGKGKGGELSNTAIGISALNSNTTGSGNTASGYRALINTTTGSNNTATGSEALSANTTGSDNTSFGRSALLLNTTGSSNTVTGQGALAVNTTGGSNTVSGAQALASNTTGGSNTAIGRSALLANTTGSNNTALGNGADVGSGALTNATALGNGAIVAASNTIQLGNASITNVKTSGTVTAGAVTYPRTDGTNGQVLTTNGSGTLSWAPGLPTSVNTGDMLYWNGQAWFKVAAGSNGQILTFYNGAPVWSTSNNAFANTVVSKTGKIWMDRNLGASQVATSSTDAASYGDLYQWGRGTDGHQIRTSATTATLFITGEPANGNFITSSGDWRSLKNDNLWQGVDGVNNPCPPGYRIPTEAEWIAELSSWSDRYSVGAFASPLKLTLAGIRAFANGALETTGIRGFYWSSTVGGNFSSALDIYGGSTAAASRGIGMSVRCIKN